MQLLFLVSSFAICMLMLKFPLGGAGVACGAGAFSCLLALVGWNWVVVLYITSSGLLSVEGAVIAGGGSCGCSVGGSPCSSCHPSKLNADSGRR